MRCCAGDEGFVALRSRPAEGLQAASCCWLKTVVVSDEEKASASAWVRVAGRRGRDVGGRRGLGPDQQDRAGCVVDDEAGGGTQAPGSQVGAVAVAGEDEEIGAVGGGGDFPLDPPGSFQPGAGQAQALGGGPEELLSGDGGQLLQAGAGVALGTVQSPVRGFRYRSCSEHVTPHVHWVTFNRWSRGQGRVGSCHPPPGGGRSDPAGARRCRPSRPQSDSAIIFRDGPAGARRRFPCLASRVWGSPAAGSTYGGTNEEGHASGFSRHLLAAAPIPGSPAAVLSLPRGGARW